MNHDQKTDILQSMINFIQQHGKERVGEIKEQANMDFTVVKEKTIESEKKRLMEQFEKDVNIAEVNLKIARSAELNRARILKMRKTNELVESLLNAAKIKMAEKLADDQDSYVELLKNLLI
jgi:V-type H+-transporting ATPase subunit E